jgi:hypothetical protein
MTAEAFRPGEAEVRVETGSRSTPLIAVLSVVSVERGPELPDLGDFPSLPEAADLAAALGALLQRFGYHVVPEPGKVPRTAEELDALVHEQVERARAEGALLILLAAGPVAADEERAGGGAPRLHQLGPDSERVATPVNDWIARVQHGLPALTGTLVLADLTRAGRLLDSELQEDLERLRLRDLRARRHWIFAAAESDEIAYDLRLTRAMIKVLSRYLDGHHPVHPSQEYLPTATLWRELHDEFTRLAVDPHQTPRFTDPRDDVLPDFFPRQGGGGPGVRIGRPGGAAGPTGGGGPSSAVDKAGDPGLFRNPSYDPDAADPEPIQRQVDADPGAAVSRMVGRDEERARLVGWLRGEGPDTLVVTGKPGAGKTTLIGTLLGAIAAGETPREPGAEGFAFVNCRGSSWAQLAGAAAEQWRLPAREGDTGDWATEEVIAALHDRSEAPLLVLDGLDESRNPGDVLGSFLLPLLSEVREDGTRLVRAVIGTRPDLPVQPLLDQVDDRRTVRVDLDDVTPDGLEAALAAFIRTELVTAGGYRQEPAEALATAAARRLAGARLPWGEFLAARIFLQVLRRRPVVHDVAEAAEQGRRVPVDLRDLMLDDLRSSGGDRWSTAVADALAFAEGAGMPEILIPVFAHAFAAEPPSATEVAGALKDLAPRYVREAMDTDGRTLYRLSSETLAEQLRSDPLPGPSTGEPLEGE